MENEFVPAAPPQPPPASGWMRLFVGCAVGCGLLALLLFVAGGGFIWWMMRPGPQRQTAAVISPATGGSFGVGDVSADPGIAAVADRFLREAQRQQQGDLPPWLRQLEAAGASGSPSAGLRMLLPRQATFSLEPSAEGAGSAVVGALNPRGFTWLLRQLLSRQGGAGSYRGLQLMRLGDHATGAFVDGTFVFASQEDALRAGIDRLLAGTAAAPSPPPDLGAPARRWDLTGVVTDRDAQLERMLWDDAAPHPGIVQARVGVDVATSDLTVGRVVVDCDSPAAAAAALEALQQRAAERADRLAVHGLVLRVAPRAEGNRAVLEWQVTGIDAAMARWLAESQHARTPSS